MMSDERIKEISTIVSREFAVLKTENKEVVPVEFLSKLLEQNFCKNMEEVSLVGFEVGQLSIFEKLKWTAVANGELILEIPEEWSK